MAELLTPQEVASILKIKKNTVYEMIKRGDIAAAKMGKQLRIDRRDLDTYLSRHSDATQIIERTEPAPDVIFRPSGLHDAPDSTVILCGQDSILDRLCDRVNSNGGGIQVLRSHKGSYNALYALYNNQVHIATAHMWDSETDTYNLTYIPKVLPAMPVNVYHILNRRQGFYVPAGNPKHIVDFSDLAHENITFVNRESGCGTRILLDGKLMKLGIDPYSIQGYRNEVSSHLLAATTVAMGGADAALGTEKFAAQVPGIEFVPLQVESYDMIIPKRFMQYAPIRMVIDTLRSDSFRRETDMLGCYDTEGMGTQLM